MKTYLKKSVVIVMAIVMTFCFCSCGSGTDSAGQSEGGAVYTFTDSCGRDVEIPENITKIAPSGGLAQIILMTFAPEMMVGVAAKPSEDQIPYLPEGVADLPEFGQFYGSKANLNMEALVAADPQIIIDLGDMKEGHADDMSKIQDQTGLTRIFSQAELANMPEAYSTKGKVLGKEEKGEEMASYIEGVLDMAEENKSKLTENEVLSVMYGTGAAGLDTNAKGSVHSAVIDRIGAENAIVTEEINNAGGGTLVSMEEVYSADPDAIILAAGGPYEKIINGAAEWADITAVKNGKVYEIPSLPYCWTSDPPSVNMVLGVLWLGNLLYPDLYDYDMVAKTQEYYKLFWDYDMTEDEAKEMLSRSTLK